MNNPRYLSCAYRDSYYEVTGTAITYYAPHVPDGAPSQWTLAEVSRNACELSDEQLATVRASLIAAVKDARKRDADRKIMDTNTFR